MRLIDADELREIMDTKDIIKWLDSLKSEIGKTEHVALWHYEEPLVIAIEALQSPKHGKWTRTGEPPMYIIECSECGQRFFHHEGQAMPKYCSECGAKMEGEEDE